MNFISKLFSKNGSHESTEQVLTAPASDIRNEELREVFADNNPPADNYEIKNENYLRIFMEQNFYQKGYNNGYEFHSAQSLENGIAVIRSEYQQLLSIRIDDMNSEIYTLELNKMQVDGMPGNIQDQFELRINAIRESIKNCKEEYEKSSNNSGNVEFSIGKYKEGYLNGQQQYFNESAFAGSTGLFN